MTCPCLLLQNAPLIRRRRLATMCNDTPYPQDGREHGYTICRNAAGELSRGPKTIGDRYNVAIDVSCPHGARPIGLFHTHPGGTTNPSQADLDQAAKFHVDYLCIAVPETGRMACLKVKHAGGSHIG